MSPRQAVGLAVAACGLCLYARAVVAAEKRYRARQRAWAVIARDPAKYGMDDESLEVFARWLDLSVIKPRE